MVEPGTPPRIRLIAREPIEGARPSANLLYGSIARGAVPAVGAVLTGVFAVSAIGGTGKSGLIDGNPAQVWLQIEGVLFTIAWSGVVSLVLLKLIDLTIGLRVSDAEQVEGLDLGEHDAAAYPDFSPTFVKSYHLREA